MSTKRRIAKKRLMEVKRAIKEEQEQIRLEREKEKEDAEWLDKNHWNFPNDYVALSFLAYNGFGKTLSTEQVYELRSLMYGNIPENYYRSYWNYSCGYCETSLWEYDREKGFFTLKDTATILDLVRWVVGNFDGTQLRAVFPQEVVSSLLSMVSEAEKEKVLIYQ